METNRKLTTILLTAGILFLLAILVYPSIKEIRRNQQMQEISLGPAEADADQNNTEEVAGDESLTEKKNLVQSQVLSETGQPVPGVFLHIQTESSQQRIGLWQGSDGVCSFFLPGFAKEGTFTMEMEESGNRLFLNGKEVKSGDGLKDIAWEQAYAMELIDQEGTTLLDSQLMFLYSSDLPVLSLTTASGSMETIDAMKGNGESGQVELLDETGAVIYSGAAESISGRGNSTWGLLKKPYQFRLMNEAPLLGDGKSKAFNLLANGYDDTKLRNKIVLDLAKELGMPCVPDYQMVDLYINQTYYGNYYLTEKIAVGEEGVDIRNLEQIASQAYTETELEKLAIVENAQGSRKWTDMQYEEADLTGGYLLERELPQRYEEENSGFITDDGDYFVLQSPYYATEAQVNYIADLVQELEDAIAEPDGRNRETGKHYLEYMDLDSFVQKYLVEEISKNYDGGVTSSFFYKPQDEISTKLYAGPVWDYDVAFGNCNLDEIASNPEGVTKLNNHILGTKMFAGLYEQEAFYQEMVEVYESKALPYLERLLDGEIDGMAEACRQSVKLDGIRWQELENRYHYYEEYDNNVRYLKYFIEQRLDFLNQVWLEDVLYHNLYFAVDGESWKIDCVKDGEVAGPEPIPTRNGSLFIGWWTEDGIPYDPYKPVYEDKTFHALWQEIVQESEAEGE